MEIFDYSEQGRRPSVKQIISDWKKAGRPSIFQVEYGETYAEFTKVSRTYWDTHGNGCRGVDRDGVVRALQVETIAP